jgi:DNA-directed RNA polymerase sigma subunit (sigma70/sigma32)
LPAERAEIVDRVQAALAVLLNDRERQVIQRRFGIGTGNSPQELEDIAFDLGIPFLAARRALVVGLAKLGKSEIVKGAHAELKRALERRL